MLGLKGSFETYDSAKERSELAANQLIDLAQQKGKVVLFGHRYMNLHIRKVLLQRNWLLKYKSNDFGGCLVWKSNDMIYQLLTMYSRGRLNLS